MSTTPRFPLCFHSRLRMATDGTGVTALVGAYGCPLACKLCINPRTWAPAEEGKDFTWVTPEELYDMTKQDNLYYLATGGGITFGGGEPLLHTDFIKAYRAICPPEWHFCAESCLNIPEHHVTAAAECIDHFMIDIKDTNPAIYKAYTGRDNQRVLDNLALLLSLVGPERITVRIPRIPGFNTDEDTDRSVALLTKMGFINFDRFTYKIPKKA
ncbi:MAG: radical SAM protein [Clostridia bacterium]|nr:radical SAM protein [Clostridia bacterium]